MTARSLLASVCLLGGAALAGCSSSDAARLERGRTLYTTLRCAQCHIADTTAEGAPLAGIHGLPVTLADGRSVVRDDAYLARAVRDPQAQIVAGFPARMPRYPSLTDEDVESLVAYIKQLR